MEWQKLVRYALQRASRASPGRILQLSAPCPSNETLNATQSTDINCLRTLTTWHCPHLPAAAAAIDRISCRPDPQYRYIDPAPHIMRPVPRSKSVPALGGTEYH